MKQGPIQRWQDVLEVCGAASGLWVFGYASLLWRPEFEEAERRSATVWGWHRTLGMWSTLNRGTPQNPGLVFALLPGGSCKGVALRMSRDHLHSGLAALWEREMAGSVYAPRFLRCVTPLGAVQALAFTLPTTSRHCCGDLTPSQLRAIFAASKGRYGTTQDYALSTYHSLQAQGIDDRRLRGLLQSVGCL